MLKITPFLWFDGQAEEAADHYISIFPNSRITSVLRTRRCRSRSQGVGPDDRIRARRQ
jgi:predicted 3-demethylubiquinone-9 3-methyltransferase (glyoxalase superfamily)